MSTHPSARQSVDPSARQSVDPFVDRRRFLSGTLLAAASAVAGPALLTGCGGGSSAEKNSTSANTSVKLPTYVPNTAITPDLRGNDSGLLDAFTQYPPSPPKLFQAPPGKGGTVSAFVQTNSPVPPALDQNQYWQELNRRLGVDLRLTIVPTADMGPKFATLIAGDDLPDFIEPALQNPQGLPTGIRNLPQWLDAKCQNLTEYLSGDAVKEWPYLANLPAAAWRACVFNGGIFGLPVPRGIAGNLMYRRDDLFAQFGWNPQPASYAEFKDLLVKMTDTRANRWAITSAGALLNFTNQCIGTPNQWRNDGGKLTHMIETPEFKQALSDVAGLFKAGVVHPDSFAANAPTKKWFNGGNALLHVDRYTGWPQYFADNVAGPSFDIGGMRPPRYSGGGFANTWQSAPTNNFTALKKADQGRIRDLLAIANWMAAPFGSEEFLFRRFGAAGVHYNMQNGGPALTQAGAAQTVLGIRYIVDAPDVIFIPGNAPATRKSYEYQASIVETSVPDPTTVLFSDTWSRKQSQLGTIVNDAQNDVFTERAPLSGWDEVVKRWRAEGGDQVRTEFEEQLQKTG